MFVDHQKSTGACHGFELRRLSNKNDISDFNYHARNIVLIVLIKGFSCYITNAAETFPDNTNVKNNKTQDKAGPRTSSIRQLSHDDSTIEAPRLIRRYQWSTKFYMWLSSEVDLDKKMKFIFTRYDTMFLSTFGRSTNIYSYPINIVDRVRRINFRCSSQRAEDMLHRSGIRYQIYTRGVQTWIQSLNSWFNNFNFK